MRHFKVYVEERTNKETGEKFKTYKALTKQGKIDLRFTKEVAEESKPSRVCELFVEDNFVNINQKFEFPVMWVSKIDHLEDITFVQNINEYLD